MPATALIKPFRLVASGVGAVAPLLYRGGGAPSYRATRRFAGTLTLGCGRRGSPCPDREVPFGSLPTTELADLQVFFRG